MTPEKYMRLPYTYCLIWDEKSRTWAGKILEFPGCIAQGKTGPETLKSLYRVALSWIAAALDLGQTIPAAVASIPPKPKP